jgi:hypothetical protein
VQPQLVSSFKDAAPRKGKGMSIIKEGMVVMSMARNEDAKKLFYS